MQAQRIVASSLIGLCSVGIGVAQDEPAATFDTTINVTVLNLEAVVVDRDGARVEGLGPSDFRLLVDGEEIPIDYFTEVRAGRFVASEDAAPEATPGEDAGVSYLVFIDEFFTIGRDKTTVLKSLAERVDNLRPADQAAVVAWDGEEVVVLTNWTSSKDAIRDAIATAIERPGLGLQRISERRQYSVTLEPDDLEMGMDMATGFNQFRLGHQERVYASILASQVAGTTGAATAAMRGLVAPEGRKALLLLAGGWPLDVAQYVGRSSARAIQETRVPSGAEIYGPLADTANLLGYSIYGIDLPGLQSGSGVDASYSQPLPASLGSTEFYLEGQLHSSLQFLARETGGLALVNGQRITALTEVGQDLRSYYWVGFTPQLARDDVRHEIRLEVKNPELAVRTRTGFLDLSANSQAKLAVQSALLYGSVPYSEDLVLELTEVQKAPKRKVQGTLTITAPASAFARQQTEEGWVLQAYLFMAATQVGGGMTELPMTPIAFITKQTPGDRTPVVYRTAIEVERKTERLTAALLDPSTGELVTRTLDQSEVK